jgi:hypothetical protein
MFCCHGHQEPGHRHVCPLLQQGLAERISKSFGDRRFFLDPLATKENLVRIQELVVRIGSMLMERER